PAIHHYLFSCPPTEPSAVFDRMQQHVTIGPLREDKRIVGIIVTIEDVTARVEHERQLADRLKHEDGAAVPDGGVAPDESRRQIESMMRLLGEDDWRVRRTAI